MSNIYKANFIQFTPDNSKVIDSNSLVAKRLEGFSPILKEDYYEEYSENYESEENSEVNALLADQDGFVSFSETHEKSLEEAYAELEEARQAAEAEIEEMKAAAQAEINSMQEEVLEIARRQGYQEGLEKANDEYTLKVNELESEKMSLEKEYAELAMALEPKIVDAITDLYSMVFGNSLFNKKDVLTTLVSKALFSIGNEEDIVIHISPDDFEEISESEEQLFENIKYTKLPEIRVEDSYESGKVKIETKYGIVDCSIETELRELARTLKMLSFEGGAK